MEALSVKDLTFTYPRCGSPAIENVGFSLGEGTLNLLFGPTGCGKSTLLSCIKKEVRPSGEMSGEIKIDSRDADSLPQSDIGFVFQDPEHQTVTDKVWHELAFAPENMGLPPAEIRRRSAEAAGVCGLSPFYEEKISELSGGQKQAVAVASVLTMRPKLLLLDEPASSLDPRSASNLFWSLRKLVNETGITVLISEHRLSELLPICDSAIAMDAGRIRASGTPAEVCAELMKDRDFFPMMPAAVKVFSATGGQGECPLTVAEGRRYFKNSGAKPEEKEYPPEQKLPAFAAELKSVMFRYKKDSPDILSDVCLNVRKGAITCVVGENGSGKTTLLGVLAGTKKAYAGSVRIFGKKISAYAPGELYDSCVALLPQDVRTLFLRKTVAEELGGKPENIPEGFDWDKLRDRHPYDLSGGEQELLGLMKVTAQSPKLLLLDEPTQGLDARSKQMLGRALKKLRDKGTTIVAVTHDIDFADDVADRCALLFRGSIICEEPVNTFMDNNILYTTDVRKIVR